MDTHSNYKFKPLNLNSMNQSILSRHTGCGHLYRLSKITTCPWTISQLKIHYLQTLSFKDSRPQTVLPMTMAQLIMGNSLQVPINTQ